jgi:predicted DNA binding CopG/RHH family protein
MTTDAKHLDDALIRDYSESWDELEDVSEQFRDIRPRKDRQLNLRVDADLLASLRDAAARRGVGYHSLARDLIEEGLARVATEPEAESPITNATRPFRMKEVMLVLLGAPGANQEENEPIVGITRLQKLLFLVAQHMKPQVAARFEAYDFGPFDESVEPDLEFLANEGLVAAPGRESLGKAGAGDAHRGAELLKWVRLRQREPDDQIEEYRLTQKGMEWVGRFFESEAFGSTEGKEALAAECARLKSEFGRVPLHRLVEYVYSEYPEFTSRSKIRHQVAERTARRLRSHKT